MKTLRWSTIIAFVLTMSLLFAGVVYAITIVVDGTREAAWDGSGGQTPGSANDGDEPGIANTKDIKEFRWTNDTSNMYFLMETWDTTGWTTSTWVVICINTDNDSATGSSSYNNCGIPGIDYSLQCYRNSCALFSGDPDNGSEILDAVTAIGRSGVYTEMSVDLTHMNLTGACDGHPMPTSIYFDGGTTDPDDNLPDSGSINLTCGSPTAVTLTRTGARTNWPIALGASIVFIGATLVLRRRR